jgi:hypothetical protein
MPSTKSSGKLSVWAHGFIPFVRERAGIMNPHQLVQDFNDTFGHIVDELLTEAQAEHMLKTVHGFE